MPITALGFLAIFSIGCMVALKRPFVGLLLYFFVFYMHPPGKYWGSFLPEIRWTFIVAIVTLISTCIHENELKRWLKPRETKLLLMFFAYVFLQQFWVDYPSIHNVYTVLFFKFLITFFLIITLVNTEKRLLSVIAVNAIGAAYIGLTAMQTHTRGRFEAAGLPSIDDGNLLCIHLIPVILCSSVIILTKFDKRKFLILIPLALIANLLFLTGSRGGLVGLLAAGAFFLWFSPKQKKGAVYKWAFVAVIGASFIAGPMVVERIKLITEATETEEVDKSAYSRFVIIEGQWNMFKDYPILGYGHRGTLMLSPDYIDEEYMTTTKAGARRGSHNLTMSYLVDHGIIGAGIYFYLLYIAISQVRQLKQNRTTTSTIELFLLGSCAGLFGLLISSQFSNSKVLEISIWVIGLICCCNYLLKHKAQEINNNHSKARQIINTTY